MPFHATHSAYLYNLFICRNYTPKTGGVAAIFWWGLKAIDDTNIKLVSGKPGATPNNFCVSCGRSGRVFEWRKLIIFNTIPFTYPFPDIACHVIQAECAYTGPV